MAKDYFQDIIPPDESGKSIPIKRTSPSPHEEPVHESAPEKNPDLDVGLPQSIPERSIRNIEAPQRPVRPIRPPVSDTRDLNEFGAQLPLPAKASGSQRGKGLLWGFAILIVLILAGLCTFAFLKTTITVIPRTHTIVFDQESHFVAMPADGSESSDTLTYTVSRQDLQDSDVVPASGTKHVESNAAGTVTIYNDYSDTPVMLVKDTRFETPSGLIFRVSDKVTVPGRVGSTPGSILASVIADQSGDQYNIGPISRFSIPGLQSNAAMYANMYARSIASTTGGFSGDQPAADPAAVQTAISNIRTRLEQKARDSVKDLSNSSTIILPDLVQIAYQDMPQTTEKDGSARINEVAHVSYTSFSAAALAAAIAATTGTDLGGSTLNLIPGKDFASQALTASSTSLGTSPLAFSLSGSATLLWQVDTTAFAKALAGHDASALTTIAAGFPSIQEAHAHIEPFWKSTFPQNANDIVVTVEEPQTP